MMPPIRTGALAALLVFSFSAVPALAQGTPATQPPVPSIAAETETQDSGVGDLRTGQWIGKPVVSSDGKPVGTLRSVETASATTDAGFLVVEREGGAIVEVPLQGASFDGGAVTVTPLLAAITAN